jgi:hypothetical protein
VHHHPVFIQYVTISDKTIYTRHFAGLSGRAVCGRSPAEIVGSNPTGGMDVCLLRVLCDVR